MNHYIPARQRIFLPSDTLSNAALKEVSAHRSSKSLADRNAEAAVTQLVGAEEDL
jgi:hypothetical protein